MHSYKFRLYPTESQKQVLTTTLETCRHLYNDSLGERSQDWDVGFYKQKQLLVPRRQDNKFYKQVHSQVLQDVLLRLDKAYQAFFKKLSMYPRFKRRERYNSFTYPQYGGFQFKRGKLILSFIGAVRIKMHRIPVGTLKRCTVIRDVDQWYCCITTDDGIDKPVASYDILKPVGIDVGLFNWLTLSDGKKIQNSLDFTAQVKRIKTLQRSLSRKGKDQGTERKQGQLSLKHGERSGDAEMTLFIRHQSSLPTKDILWLYLKS